MIRKNLQLRCQVEKGGSKLPELKRFEYDGDTFEIKGISENTHLIPAQVPIGVVMSGFTRQYIAVSEKTKDNYEVYVYYYRKVEGDLVAIVDNIEKI